MAPAIMSGPPANCYISPQTTYQTLAKDGPWSMGYLEKRESSDKWLSEVSKLRKQFFTFFIAIFALIAAGSLIWPGLLWSLVFVGPLFALGLRNAFQKKRAILRNFPILGNFRYLFEMVRPEIQQYFVESETNGTPIPREIRSVIYQRAKEQI